MTTLPVSLQVVKNMYVFGLDALPDSGVWAPWVAEFWHQHFNFLPNRGLANMEPNVNPEQLGAREYNMEPLDIEFTDSPVCLESGRSTTTIQCRSQIRMIGFGCKYTSNSNGGYRGTWILLIDISSPHVTQPLEPRQEHCARWPSGSWFLLSSLPN